MNSDILYHECTNEEIMEASVNDKTSTESKPERYDIARGYDRRILRSCAGRDGRCLGLPRCISKHLLRKGVLVNVFLFF